MKIGSVLFTFIEKLRQQSRETIMAKVPEVLETLVSIGYEGAEGVPRDSVPLLSEKNLKLITVGFTFPQDEEIQEIAEFASQNGAKTIVVGPSRAYAREIWLHGYNEKNFKDEIKRLNDLGKKCRDYGVDLCAHFEGKAVLSMDKILELTDPEYVNLCLDTGWMMAGLRDPMKIITKHIDRIKHVHLKDWRATPFNVGLDGPLLGEFCELGTGEVDHPEIFKILKEAGYDGWYVVEIPVFHNRDASRAPSPEESAKINFEYLKKFV